MSLIVALDTHSLDAALAIADQLDPTLCRVKVGKELFTYTGPAVVQALHARGFEVFLDLKFHDIPNTTAHAVQAAADLGVWMVNVHASGGRQMMQTSAARLKQGGYATHLIGVTVLTSMSAEDLLDVGITISPAEQVVRLAQLAYDSGLGGVVCSAQEAALLRAKFGPEFLLVTPGIRPAGSNADDQKRIVTPADAMRQGVSHMVVGRPITQAASPKQAVLDILASI
ncbi:orotidine-5'-phosphate decarboxylase [Aquirhabdus parva]|uniref:Orotidine 5'-phosphate decarboxylase n=1 Tax=Aquirhabdus parva TaxID=2283318 RepID=A0A345P503_9GAMM|nr:orotidine-5'-phosphate decarboxylase [Aquirhabdus parva]AXI02362.1 orotidine-5'-phosphate decarboxylase [Aquirhabdus parva]